METEQHQQGNRPSFDAFIGDKMKLGKHNTMGTFADSDPASVFFTISRFQSNIQTTQVFRETKAQNHFSCFPNF